MATSAANTPEDQVRSIHQYKTTPPIYDGDFSNFEEWKYKFTAYIGLMNPIFPRLLQQTERSTDAITDTLLRAGADTIKEGETWIRLATELQFITVSITKKLAATVCRQMGLASNGLETWRQLVIRFSIPVGTRSIGYLTKLLKPSFDESKFEEAFASWEFEINRYEPDKSAILPDNIKIAVLLNETLGALQQHLQLTASHVTPYQRIRKIIIEYCRAAASFSRMQQLNGQQPKDDKGPAPMDIGATWKGEGKGKGKKGHHKGKGKESQHTKERNTTTPTTTTTKEKEKAMVPSVKEIHSKVHQKATPAKASHYLTKEKERTTPQHATNVANKVTSPGTVEFPSATTTWENKATCQIQHTINSTTHNNMTHPGTIRI